VSLGDVLCVPFTTLLAATLWNHLITCCTVPTVYVDGKEIEKLAWDDFGRPQRSDLQRCIVNADDVRLHARIV
jgi:hypothetical protein